MRYSDVPKEIGANLRFRKAVLLRAANQPALRGEILKACKEDILFFINCFVYTYNPHDDQKVWPFITYPFQDDALGLICGAVSEGRDAVVYKSRRQGASWLCCMAMDHFWLFKSMQRFYMISRKEKLVDSAGDPDSLFWKLDYIHKNLPAWMLLEGRDYIRRRLHFENMKNGSTMTGDTTTEGAGVGGRCTAMFLDEFSRMEDGDAIIVGTRDTTRCRIFNFTPFGANQAVAKVLENTSMIQVRLPWFQNPSQNNGLYKYDNEILKFYKWSDSKKEVVEIPKPKKLFHPNYQFVLDGKLRSLEYDKEWFRSGPNPRDMAENWDMDLRGSQWQFFSPPHVREYVMKYCCPPYIEGDLEHDALTGKPLRFVQIHGGPVKLWMRLDHQGDPPQADYAGACDVSMGTGRSNSCLSCARTDLGEKVLEYATSSEEPHQFAVKCVAICSWLRNSYGTGALLVWEKQGPGFAFGKKVLELGYTNYYKAEGAGIYKPNEIPGWFNTRDSKSVLLEDYRSALGQGWFINRSEHALLECLDFVVHPKKGIVHLGSIAKDDPTGAEANHGDRVIADGLCWKLCKGKTNKEKPPEETPVAYASLGFRHKMANAVAQRTVWK